MKTVNTYDMHLVYVSEDGNEHHQHFTDVVDMGTLVDPETGDDMKIVGWAEKTNTNTHDMHLVYIAEDGSTHDQHYSDVVDMGTLIDPNTGDDMKIIGWVAEEL